MGAFWFQFWVHMVTVVQVGAAVGLFALYLPRRPQFGLRVGVVASLAVLACVLTATTAGTALLYALPLGPGFLPYVALFLLTILATAFLFDGPRWSATFCATMGYTVQNLWMSVYRLVALGLWKLGLLETVLTTDFVVELATTAVVYLACYWVFARQVRRAGLVFASNPLLLWVAALVLVFDIAYSTMVTILDAYATIVTPTGVSMGMAVFFSVSHLIICVLLLGFEFLLLFSRRMHDESVATRQILETERRQFEASRQNQQALQVKCHDLKHQIRSLRAGSAVSQEVLDDLAREVATFENSYDTGNEALDVILSEKGRVAAAQGTRLECIVDGALLGFMAPADVYALFGNALDNALEAVAKVPEGERVVSLRVHRTGSMAAIRVENPFAGELTFVDGLPRTSKDDQTSHGFGSLSMRLLTERYDGLMDISTAAGWYILSIVLPLPE